MLNHLTYNGQEFMIKSTVQRWYPIMENHCEDKLGKSRMGTGRSPTVPKQQRQLRKNKTKQQENIEMTKIDKLLYGGFAVVAIGGIVAMLVSVSPRQSK